MVLVVRSHAVQRDWNSSILGIGWAAYFEGSIDTSSAAGDSR
jgi:hypothetical protein